MKAEERLQVSRLVGDIPVFKLDGTVEYNLGGKISVPMDYGVYLIHDLRGTLYVGRTENLQRRYDEHYWETNNPLLRAVICKPFHPLKFSWIISAYSDQVALERLLIRYFEPICNRMLCKSGK